MKKSQHRTHGYLVRLEKSWISNARTRYRSTQNPRKKRTIPARRQSTARSNDVQNTSSFHRYLVSNRVCRLCGFHSRIPIIGPGWSVQNLYTFCFRHVVCGKCTWWSGQEGWTCQATRDHACGSSSNKSRAFHDFASPPYAGHKPPANSKMPRPHSHSARGTPASATTACRCNQPASCLIWYERSDEGRVCLDCPHLGVPKFEFGRPVSCVCLTRPRCPTPLRGLCSTHHHHTKAPYHRHGRFRCGRTGGHSAPGRRSSTCNGCRRWDAQTQGSCAPRRIAAQGT